MEIRWLGWAGVELEAHGERLVIDPLQDAGAVFAPLGDIAARIPVPEVVPARPGALAGLVTHLHRDHADAAALTHALAPGAPILEPVGCGGAGSELLAIAQADAELSCSGLARAPLAIWTTVHVGPFAITALPAVDGTGDPQVSWLIESGGVRVLHLGDTMFHGWWWRIAARFGAPDVVLAPINGARLTFPHRRPPSPLPAVLDPDQAALAATLLGARTLVPIHYGGYELAGLYEPIPDALARVMSGHEHVAAPELGGVVDAA